LRTTTFDRKEKKTVLAAWGTDNPNHPIVAALVEPLAEFRPRLHSLWDRDKTPELLYIQRGETAFDEVWNWLFGKPGRITGKTIEIHSLSPRVEQIYLDHS
jgi:hypothetical protein